MTSLQVLRLKSLLKFVLMVICCWAIVSGFFLLRHIDEREIVIHGYVIMLMTYVFITLQIDMLLAFIFLPHFDLLTLNRLRDS